MTGNERNELIRFIESITFNIPKDGKPSWIKPAIDMITAVIIDKIDDIYNENEMRETENHIKSYEELQNTITDLSHENCLLKNKIEGMMWISVRKRLPEDGQKVLTCKNGIIAIQEYEKRRNGWIKGNWFWSMATVSHWMPLPEPWKG